MAASSSSAGPSRVTAVRGTLISCVDDPFLTDPATAFVHESDGLVICRDGLIAAAGPFEALKNEIEAGVEITHYPGCLISPGFIDTHVHYVQTPMIASYGKQLLDWLNDYTYVVEQEFADEVVARDVAALFCEELLRNGTTTALVFCAVYPQSVDALFSEAARRNMRIASGKVLMDRNCPAPLRDTAQSGYDQSKALIAKWHGRGRALYAVTPRYAGSSTPEQLELAGTLWKEHPGTLMQTHIAENRDEVAMVMKLFPKRQDYLDIYDHYGLIGRGAVLAHGIYLTERARCRCHEADAAVAHCPTSNLFLGSGLFRMDAAKDPKRPIHVGLGTDIGAGTSFSLLATMGEAYKVAQLNSYSLSAVEAFFLATLGGARALDLEGKIGTLAPGREADLVVLDPNATPLLAFRNGRSQSIEESLFVLMTMGDDRAVRATYVAGQRAHARAPVDS
jgi:guanine deaminase